MKLYHWTGCESTKLYGHGQIIVLAPSLDAARLIVSQASMTANIGYYDMTDLSYWAAQDDDERERYDNALKLVARDIARAPVIYDEPTALFISGSE